MKLLRLELEDFRSYGPREIADFVNTPHAVVLGDNGSGKSTILDALAWALYGVSRSSGISGIIRTGAEECVVEVDFEIDGVTWRVRRTRQIRTKAGGGSLDLAKWDGSTWRTETQKRVAETETYLAGLIGISYDAFITAAMIGQGSHGAFLLAKPSRRRELLRDMIGAQSWEVAALEAGRKSRRHSQSAAHITDTLNSSRLSGASEAALRPLLDRSDSENVAIRTTTTQIEEARKRRIKHDQNAELAETKVRELLGLQDAHTAWAGRGRELLLIQDFAVTEQAYAATAHQDTEFNAATADEIPAHNATIAELLAGDEQRAALVIEHQRLKDEYVEVRRHHESLERGADAFLMARVHVDTALHDASVKGVDLDGLTQVEIQTMRNASDLRSEELGAGRASQGVFDALSRARAELSGAQAKLSSRKHQAALLEGVPCFGHEMASRCKLLGDANDAARSVPHIEAEVTKLIESVTVSESALSLFRQQRDEGETLARNVVQMDTVLRALSEVPDEQDQELRGEVASRLASITEQGHAVKAKLDAVPSSLNDLADAKAKLKVAQRAQETLERSGGTERATARLRAADAALSTAWVDHEQHSAKQPQCPNKNEVDSARAASTDERRMSANQLERGERLASTLSRLEREQTVTTNRIDQMNVQIAEIEKLTGQLATAQDLKTRWAATQEVCRLAPTILIETIAVPELERVANEVLTVISDGMRVRIDTQATKKDGGSKETVDIIVSDREGSRPIEDYSGGETFRVSIAFALAQSALLNQRDSAPADFLFIDEGWGSLDKTGVRALSEVIGGLTSMYSLVWIITHVDAAAECLPKQVWITRGQDGCSKIDVR